MLQERTRGSPHQRWYISRDFLLLWSGQTVSLFGSELSATAFMLLAIAQLHAGPRQLALLTGAGILPALIGGSLAGILADRIPRRAILIVTDLARAALLGSIALLAAGGALRFTALLAILVLTKLLSIIFDVAQGAIIPDLVRNDLLLAGNARMAASSASAEIGGQALSGLLYQWVGAATLCVIDAATFLISCASLLTIRQVGTPHEEQGIGGEAVGAGWRGLTSGWITIWNGPWLRTLALAESMDALKNGIFATLYLLYALHDLHIPLALIGPLIAIGGMASLGGTVLATRTTTTMGPRRSVLLMHGLILAGGVCTIAAVGGDGLRWSNVILLGIGQASDCGWSAQTILTATIIQEQTPAALRGRVLAVFRLLSLALLPVGAALTAILSNWLSTRALLVVSVLIECISWFVLWYGAPRSAGTVASP